MHKLGCWVLAPVSLLSLLLMSIKPKRRKRSKYDKTRWSNLVFYVKN